MTGILDIKYSADEIVKKRAEIAQGLTETSQNIKNSSIRRISDTDLRQLFKLYDGAFLNNWFKDSYKGRMKFSLSKRMTKSAGVTLCPKNIAAIKPEELVIEIRISMDLIFQYGAIEGHNNVCGIKTGSSLEALQLVFEHELCHAVEFILFKKSSCSGERFRSMAGRLFGHTERYHALPTAKQIAVQKLNKYVGDAVTFSHEGKEYKGVIYSINKRAAVMVRDKGGRYADSKGDRYTKYYVPLTMLK